MTDRELLEAAARAAGIAIRWAKDLNGYIYDVDWGYSPREMWRPLTDDGDALRLAVKMSIHITNSDTDAWASTPGADATLPLAPDPYAATRRAIVRAAAACAPAAPSTDP